MKDIDNDGPIFIAGIQRSGTSLMRGIVGSHPDVAIFQWDLPLWTELYGKYEGRDISKSNNLNNLVNDIVKNKKVKNSDGSINREDLIKKIKKENDISIGFVFQCFLEEYAQVRGKKRWGLKTPNNEFFADEIFNSYPNARIIHMVRDPRDVAVSFQSYSDGWWIYSPCRHIKEWKESLKLSKRNEEIYKGQYIVVKYEDLVTHPKSTMSKVCSLAGLDFDPKILESTDHPGWEGSNSFFDDIGKSSKNISSQGIGRYKNKLKPNLTYYYEYYLKKYLLEQGYEINSSNVNKKYNYLLKVKILCFKAEILIFLRFLKKKLSKLKRKITF